MLKTTNRANQTLFSEKQYHLRVRRPKVESPKGYFGPVIHHPKGTTDHHLKGPLNHHLNGAIYTSKILSKALGSRTRAVMQN